MDGNVGMQDCLTAAEWSAKYIKKFGGNGKKITTIGQSAGAGIINYLMFYKGGRGKLPFQQVRRLPLVVHRCLCGADTKCRPFCRPLRHRPGEMLPSGSRSCSISFSMLQTAPRSSVCDLSRKKLCSH